MPALNRLLQVDLALRAYEASHGHYPANLRELVPKYLEALPADPFSDKDFCYQTSGYGYLLYSVGPDGIDNGGDFSTLASPGYWNCPLDLNLDAHLARWFPAIGSAATQGSAADEAEPVDSPADPPGE